MDFILGFFFFISETCVVTRNLHTFHSFSFATAAYIVLLKRGFKRLLKACAVLAVDFYFAKLNLSKYKND